MPVFVRDVIFTNENIKNLQLEIENRKQFVTTPILQGKKSHFSIRHRSVEKPENIFIPDPENCNQDPKSEKFYPTSQQFRSVQGSIHFNTNINTKNLKHFFRNWKQTEYKQV